MASIGSHSHNYLHSGAATSEMLQYQEIFSKPRLGAAPCHKGDFNLSGGPYKIFQMILSFVTKIFQNQLLFKIFDEGFMVNQHSKGITKPKFELQLHLVQKVHFIQKDSYANYLLYGTLGTCVALIGAEL